MNLLYKPFLNILLVGDNPCPIPLKFFIYIWDPVGILDCLPKCTGPPTGPNPIVSTLLNSIGTNPAGSTIGPTLIGPIVLVLIYWFINYIGDTYF